MEGRGARGSVFGVRVILYCPSAVYSKPPVVKAKTAVGAYGERPAGTPGSPARGAYYAPQKSTTIGDSLYYQKQKDAEKSASFCLHINVS